MVNQILIIQQNIFRKLTLFLVLFVFPYSTFSQEWNKPYRFTFGVQSSNYSYREFIPSLDKKSDSEIMNIQGIMTGVNGTIEYIAIKKIVFGLNAQYSYGILHYSSNFYRIYCFDSYIASTITETDIRDHLFETKVNIGYSTNFLGFECIPKLGFAFRYLYDNQQEAKLSGFVLERNTFPQVNKLNSKAYNRISRYLYIPIGFNLTKIISDKWSSSFGFEFDYFIKGWQSSFLSEADTNMINIRNNQTKGFGLHTSLSLTRLINETMHISIVPFINLWKIEKSDQVKFFKDPLDKRTGNEPKNTTFNIGLSLKIEM